MRKGHTLDAQSSVKIYPVVPFTADSSVNHIPKTPVNGPIVARFTVFSVFYDYFSSPFHQLNINYISSVIFY